MYDIKDLHGMRTEKQMAAKAADFAKNQQNTDIKDTIGFPFLILHL